MTPPERVFITGRGLVSPLGNDWPSFAAAVREQRPAPLVPFPGSLAPDAPLCHVAPLPDDGSRRDVEPLTAIATIAAGAALHDAGIRVGEGSLEDVGLVMSTALGPATAVEQYLETLAAKGPRASRPALFVDTLLSMPASRLGIALGLRGSTAVLGASSPFELALEWLQEGREHTVLAGAGEYAAPKCARFYQALAVRSGARRAPLGQGAAFVVLESARRAAARGAVPLAELAGAGAASEPQEVSVPWSSNPRGALAAAMRSALTDAGIDPAAVDMVALAAGDDASEAGELAALADVLGGRLEHVTLLRPKRLLGEALAASSALTVLAALAELEAAGPEIALANAFEMGGAATSLVLRSA